MVSTPPPPPATPRFLAGEGSSNLVGSILLCGCEVDLGGEGINQKICHARTPPPPQNNFAGERSIYSTIVIFRLHKNCPRKKFDKLGENRRGFPILIFLVIWLFIPAHWCTVGIYMLMDLMLLFLNTITIYDIKLNCVCIQHTKKCILQGKVDTV